MVDKTPSLTLLFLHNIQLTNYHISQLNNTMKKLYRKGTVHPSPSPSPSPSSSHFLSLSTLPATILALAAALSVSDKEVLAYLLSCTTNTPFDFDPSKTSSSPKKHKKPYTSNNNNNGSSNNNSNSNNNGHVTCFTCYCFNCYTSYWARWDSSPNRQLIHEIIDALEENLLAQKKKKQGVNKKDKKKNVNNVVRNDINGVNEKYKGSVRVNPESSRVVSVEDGGGLGQVDDDAGEKQGIVRKMVSFVWGSVWG